ncbi:hypothetical protein FNF27_04100 [Cafeteria roenbergensis]|uniref:Uncharacterized protein n=2 Tax=Cafeteria roenbergensis TaxID=33653 RepID=A0A5A8D4Y7_CAFRO|nr:hypothetical protein FNF31_04685 [Cafeteria roenbergensis]KAA0174504.1 hypothetical protein FNF27_04100 [Cafeteria roenbergensis]
MRYMLAGEARRAGAVLDGVAEDMVVNEAVLARAVVSVRAGELVGLRQQQVRRQHALGGAEERATDSLADMHVASAIAAPVPNLHQTAHPAPVWQPLPAAEGSQPRGWLRHRADDATAAAQSSRAALASSPTAGATDDDAAAGLPSLDQTLACALPGLATPSPGVASMLSHAAAEGLYAGAEA